MANPKITRPFSTWEHTCSTNDPSFEIEIGQVRFLVLIFDHSVTTYSALAGTHVNSIQGQGNEFRAYFTQIT